VLLDILQEVKASKNRFEAFKPLNVLFLWSLRTVMGKWQPNRIFLYSLQVSIVDIISVYLLVFVYLFGAVFSF
jgi:hypothetical protein